LSEGGQRTSDSKRRPPAARRSIRLKEVDVVAKPSPSELTAPINPDRGVEGHRNLFCTSYDGCLDEAVKKGWNSWTCTHCQLFAVEPDLEAGLENYATQRRLG